MGVLFSQKQQKVAFDAKIILHFLKNIKCKQDRYFRTKNDETIIINIEITQNALKFFVQKNVQRD